MGALLWTSGAILLSAALSIVVAVREVRRRNFVLGGFALVCLLACVIAAVQPVPTHAVSVTLPMGDAH